MECRAATGPLTEPELRDWYAEPAGVARWVRGSFITSLDGRATGPSGLSGSLNEGSNGDHAVFSLLRTWADAVVVGAGTVRAEGYGPLAEATLVILTADGDVPKWARESSEVLILDGHGVEFPPEQVLAELQAHGWSRIVIEGGPHLFAPWVQDGLADELCVTVRPVLAGGDGPLLTPATLELEQIRGQATHVLSWEGDLLLRTRLT